jgi:DNA primase
VLPVVEDGRAIYAQLRRLHSSPGQPRYLSVAGTLAPNPGLAVYHPVVDRGGPLVVTEGPTDALAATAAGYQAAAVFGVGAAGPNAARLLARQSRPVVIAFDADEAGRAGCARLVALMAEAGAPAPMVLRVPAHAGDLAGWLASASDWQRTFRAAVALGGSGRAAGTAVALR